MDKDAPEPPTLREVVALGMPVQYDVWITNNCPWIRLRSFSVALSSADQLIKHLKIHGYEIVCDSHSKGNQDDRSSI